MKIAILVGASLLYPFALLEAKAITKSLTISILEQEVNGIRFARRVESIDGKRKEGWSIEGSPVSAQEYEERMVAAERQEALQERQKEEEAFQKNHVFQLHAQQQIIKKLLLVTSEKVRQELFKLKNPLLLPYLCFSPNSVGNGQALQEIEQALQEAFQASGEEELRDIFQEQERIEKLEQYYDQLQGLYRDTLEYAMKKCDDPKILKELLRVVC